MARAKAIKYTDSESNELMIGVLHACILPFAMFELGNPWAFLQFSAHIAGVFQVYCALWDGRLFMRKIAVQIASVISIATVANYTMAGMMRVTLGVASHLRHEHLELVQSNQRRDVQKVMSESFLNIAITAVTVLGSAGAWQFYQNRLKLKHEEKKEDRGEQTMFRDDLRERVAVLEEKLEEAYNEKQRTKDKLTEVLTELAEYKVRLEFLEKENERLRNIR